MSQSLLAERIKQRTEDLESKYGLWMSRHQIERKLLHIGSGTFPVEKLKVYDIGPVGKRLRYSTQSVAAFLVSHEVPQTLWAQRKKVNKDSRVVDT